MTAVAEPRVAARVEEDGSVTAVVSWPDREPLYVHQGASVSFAHMTLPDGTRWRSITVLGPDGVDVRTYELDGGEGGGRAGAGP